MVKVFWPKPHKRVLVYEEPPHYVVFVADVYLKDWPWTRVQEKLDCGGEAVELLADVPPHRVGAFEAVRAQVVGVATAERIETISVRLWIPWHVFHDGLVEDLYERIASAVEGCE